MAAAIALVAIVVVDLHLESRDWQRIALADAPLSREHRPPLRYTTPVGGTQVELLEFTPNRLVYSIRDAASPAGSTPLRVAAARRMDARGGLRRPETSGPHGRVGAGGPTRDRDALSTPAAGRGNRGQRGDPLCGRRFLRFAAPVSRATPRRPGRPRGARPRRQRWQVTRNGLASPAGGGVPVRAPRKLALRFQDEAVIALDSGLDARPAAPPRLVSSLHPGRRLHLLSLRAQSRPRRGAGLESGRARRRLQQLPLDARDRGGAPSGPRAGRPLVRAWTHLLSGEPAVHLLPRPAVDRHPDRRTGGGLSPREPTTPSAATPPVVSKPSCRPAFSWLPRTASSPALWQGGGRGRGSRAFRFSSRWRC